MSIVATPSEVLEALAKALDLPKNSVGFVLRAWVGEAVTLEVTSYIDDGSFRNLVTTIEDLDFVAVNRRIKLPGEVSDYIDVRISELRNHFGLKEEECK